MDRRKSQRVGVFRSVLLWGYSTIFYKGIKIEPFELRDMVISFMGNKMYNRVKIQVNESVFNHKPKILIALKSEVYKSFLTSLQDYLKEKTGVAFIIEEVSYSYFGDFISTKDKIVEYVK